MTYKSHSNRCQNARGLIQSLAAKRKNKMSRKLHFITQILLTLSTNASFAGEDSRQFVELPEMMQQHMMSNMRDHLAAINEILITMANGQLDRAADIAELRLGMSSLQSHEASHMARFMPENMRLAGTSMHRAASRFALKAQEGELVPAYSTLSEVTSACVACHSGYRIR
jgi:hypothetical protein